MGISKNITVIGFGSWGIALSCLLNKKGHNVTAWEYKKDLANYLNNTRKHPIYLADVSIPRSIKITGDIKKATENSQIFVLVVPSGVIDKVISQFIPFFNKNDIIISASKGFIEHGCKRICEYLEEILPSCHIVALMGPSHAEEVSRNLPTAVVAASTNEDIAIDTSKIFSGSNFRVYTTTDIIGAEIGGALKNVIALAAGISDGLGFGDNTKAALMTRGIVEIGRLGVAMGAYEHTFSGLSGIGDLIVTCTSQHSRNWRAGNLLAKGKEANEVLKDIGMVVEGINTSKSALMLSKKYNVDMPIVKEINKILFEGKNPHSAVVDLMLRDRKDEFLL